jgi:putative ABC transport system permease protein
VFRLVGALDKTGTGLDNAVFIGRENLGDIIKSGAAKIGKDQISIAFVKVKAGVNPNAVAAEIEDSVIEVDAVARKDIGKNIITTLKDMSRIFTVTVILASVLSFFLVWAIFTAIANERSKEVGIMRAVGAKESHILRLFFIEALLIGAAGSVLGIIGGSLFSVLFSKGFSIVRQLSTDLTLTERSVIAALSFLLGSVICGLGALGPVRRVKKMEPLMVIKVE